MPYAENTQVNESRSREEIERMLMRFGATEFGYMTKPGEALIGFVFRGLRVQFTVAQPQRDDPEFATTPTGRKRRDTTAAYKAWEQECRRRWRSLAAVVKAKLVAVDDGVATFETEFLPYMVTSDGRTVGQRLVPRLESAIQSGKGFLALPKLD